MAHGVTPGGARGRAGARRRTPAPPSSSRRPTTAWRPTSRAAPRSAHAAGVPLVVDQAWGPHFGFHPDLPPSRARSSAPTRCSPRRTRSSARSRSRRCCTSAPTGRIDPDVGRAHGAARAHDLAVVAADGLARRRAAPARDPRRGAAGAHDRGVARAPARRSTPSTGCARGRRGVRRPPGRRRLGPAADRHRRPRHRLHAATRSRPRCARPTTSTSSSPRTRRWCSSSASTSRRSALERFAHDFAHDGAPDRAPGRAAAALVRALGLRSTTRSSSRRARRSSATPRSVAVDDARRPRVGRVDRRLPAGHPGAAAGRADHRRGRRLPARAARRRRAPARRQRPGVPRPSCVLCDVAVTDARGR